MESTITKIICANGGSISAEELQSVYFGRSERVSDVVANQEKFLLCHHNEEQMVVARTRLGLCKTKDCQGCNSLHLCKGFLFGNCQFDRGRRRCRFSHDLTSAYNNGLLIKHDLDNLDKAELCTLLLQNDRTLLPPVCHDYNNGLGEYGRCQDGEYCTRLHICEIYLSGPCSCPRAHDFYEPHPQKTLQKRGVPNMLFCSMKMVYMNKELLRIWCNKGNKGNMGRQPQQQTGLFGDIPSAANNATDSADDSAGAGRKKNRKRNNANMKDKIDICMYFIKGHCKHGERCFKAHHNLPYRWEVKEGQQWTALPENEEIEEDFCNPKKTYSRGVQPVCFDTMTCELNSARRLSTVSSVLQPTFIFTTEWVWYWEDEFGTWNPYATATGQHGLASITSMELEDKFQNDDQAVVEFSAGSQSYTLSFPDMIQTNKRYGTKRVVRRRPKFVSSAEAQIIKTRRPVGNQSHFKDLPAHWDKTLIPETGYKRVQLQSTSGEYKEIESLFRSTLRGFDIYQIERIQNKALWEVFQWQKTQMKKNNGGQNVTEKKLFHGTDPKHIDAICLNNFDWRICGTHGTAYGKGSYFARDAKYSHSYTGESSVKSMFISRILVGTYTKGCSSYLRPPSKDGGDTHFYDSCVDDVGNPSIFVVFEKHQIYPEYLLTYEEKVSYSSPYYTRVAAAAPAPAPRPAPASRPTTTSWTTPASTSASSTSTSTPRAAHWSPPPTPLSQPTYSSYSSSNQSYQKKQSDSCVVS